MGGGGGGEFEILHSSLFFTNYVSNIINILLDVFCLPPYIGEKILVLVVNAATLKYCIVIYCYQKHGKAVIC